MPKFKILGNRIQDFGYPNLGFENPNPGAWYPNPGFGYPNPGFGCPNLRFGYPYLGFGFQIQDFTYPNPRFGYPNSKCVHYLLIMSSLFPHHLVTISDYVVIICYYLFTIFHNFVTMCPLIRNSINKHLKKRNWLTNLGFHKCGCNLICPLPVSCFFGAEQH